MQGERTLQCGSVDTCRNVPREALARALSQAKWRRAPETVGVLRTAGNLFREATGVARRVHLACSLYPMLFPVAPLPACPMSLP